MVRHKTDRRCWSPHGPKECNIADGTSMVLKSDCRGSGVMMTFRKNNTIAHTCSGKCLAVDNNNQLTLREGPCDSFRKQERSAKEWIIVHEKHKLCVGVGNVKTGQLVLTSCDLKPTLFELSQEGKLPKTLLLHYNLVS